MTRRDEWSFFWYGLLIGAALVFIVCTFITNRALTKLSDEAHRTIAALRQRAEACEGK